MIFISRNSWILQESYKQSMHNATIPDKNDTLYSGIKKSYQVIQQSGIISSVVNFVYVYTQS